MNKKFIQSNTALTNLSKALINNSFSIANRIIRFINKRIHCKNKKYFKYNTQFVFDDSWKNIIKILCDETPR